MPPQTCALVVAVAGETETAIWPSWVRAAEWSDHCSIQGHNQIIHRPDPADAGCSTLALLLCPLLSPVPILSRASGSGWAFGVSLSFCYPWEQFPLPASWLSSSRCTTLFPLF